MSTANPLSLLIVDDDSEFRGLLARRFSQHGYHVEEAASGEQALEALQRREFDVALFDMMMPGMSGLALLETLKAQRSECEVIMLTGQATVESAVAAMKAGAYDYLTKPFPLRDLELVVEKARDHRRLAKENQQLRQLLARSQSGPELIGESAAMQEVYRLIERAGPSERAILIQGESGTG